MAGDWIKFEHTTPDKPEIVRIASELRIDQDAVTGKLFRLWAWADQNSVDGESIPVTAAFIDRLTNRKGFALAMRAAGWLVGEDGSLTFPNFERHNGTTAKARAESNRRMKKSRETKPDGCGNVAEKPQQKPQPEKRREEGEGEEEEPPPPAAPSTPPAEPEDAHIPTVDEVKAFGSGPAAIPPGYCENFHAKTTEKRMWLNGYGKLVDWKKQIVRWWAGDRGRWDEKSRRTEPAAKPVRISV